MPWTTSFYKFNLFQCIIKIDFIYNFIIIAYIGPCLAAIGFQQPGHLVALDTYRQFGLAAEKNCVSPPALSV